MFGLFKNKKKVKKDKTEEVQLPPIPTLGETLNVNEFVLDTFLKLTSKTYPYGDEDGLVEDLIKLKLFPDGIQKDPHGNYFYKIGDSRTMFTSHLDTACKDQKDVTHVFEKCYIKTNGDTILGADDKAGMTVMLYMMRNNVPGLYYFFVGEEVGCVGSGLAAKYINFKGSYDRCVSFDRRGTDSVITYQSSSRCCSDDFATQLAKELNKSGYFSYKKDDTGVYTDSAEFTSDIPECTNISVGYYKEHTIDESQDIDHLTKLAEACISVDWENLITKRDPSKTEYKSWSYGYGSYGSYGGYGKHNSNNWRNRDDYGYGWGSSTTTNKDLKKTYGYHDDWYSDDKKTRRGGKKNKNNKNKSNKPGKSFYDNGAGLIDLEMKSDFTFVKSGIYDWVKFKLLDGGLSKDELEIIKVQYLDMDDEDDRKFYDTVLSFTKKYL